jgi:hypothetical protein
MHENYLVQPPQKVVDPFHLSNLLTLFTFSSSRLCAFAALREIRKSGRYKKRSYKNR